MASVWSLAGQLATCGNCWADLEPNAPMLAVYLPGLSRPRYRCVACAEHMGLQLDEVAIQRARAVLGEAQERQAIESEARSSIASQRGVRAVREPSKFTALRDLPFDPKAAAARSGE